MYIPGASLVPITLMVTPEEASLMDELLRDIEPDDTSDLVYLGIHLDKSSY